MSYAALAEEDRYAPAGLGCDRDCRCSAGRGLSGLAQTPPAPTHVREVRVVVKSFIRCIGGSVGSLPLWCPLGSSLRLRAMAFATDRMMCEEPMHDRKDKRYRLFSACTFQVTCQNGNVTAVTPSALDTDTGKEGPLQAPPLIASPVRVVRTADGFEFSWFARGRPHLAAEPPFQLVCPRTSVYIWHRVSGRVRCTPEGTDVSVNLSGSKFPTHRVFVNGTPVRTVPQGGFARLWFPVSLTEPTRVEGFSADATPRRFGGGTGLAEGDFVVGQAPCRTGLPVRMPHRLPPRRRGSMSPGLVPGARGCHRALLKRGEPARSHSSFHQDAEHLSLLIRPRPLASGPLGGQQGVRCHRSPSVAEGCGGISWTCDAFSVWWFSRRSGRPTMRSRHQRIHNSRPPSERDFPVPAVLESGTPRPCYSPLSCNSGGSRPCRPILESRNCSARDAPPALSRIFPACDSPPSSGRPAGEAEGQCPLLRGLYLAGRGPLPGPLRHHTMQG